MERAQREDQAEVKEQLGRIETQAKLTNGRISQLELWQARVLGAVGTVAWLPTVATGVITALLVYLITT